jgi:hypothetical protein
VLILKRDVLHRGYAAEFSQRMDAMKIAACHSYCHEGRASALGAKPTVLGSSLPVVVGWVCDVSTVGAGCASRFAGTPGSSTQAGLHLLLV